MNQPNRPRGFEDRLLNEFRTYFDERNQTMTNTEETPAKTPRFGRATKFSFAGGIGAVALGIGAVVALPALTASPAYAVEEKDNGNIDIELYGPQDPEGLEEALAEYGIQSQVDFPPSGMGCAPDRFEPAESDNQLSESMTMRSGDEDAYIAFNVNPDNYAIGGDTTLVIEISEDFFEHPVKPDNGDLEVMVSSGLAAAKGEVGDCDPQPIDDDDIEIDDAEKHDADGDAGATEKKDDDGSKSKNKD
ncbi:hypothetical protein Snas_4593 [Stackebrandtia nassauensis DSM 44728]|uniref:Uncharacterized protein n=2 Tax=Stackebrandtia TaxID=283810 RepID=D3Q6J4_STANL|nr:hypothetical protein Snas_4593 [Stackebrandtia nassauensis DSM 44728]